MESEFTTKSKWVGHLHHPVMVRNSKGDIITLESGNEITLEDVPEEEERYFSCDEGDATITAWYIPTEDRKLANFPYVQGDSTGHLRIVVSKEVVPHIPWFFTGGVYTLPDSETRMGCTAGGDRYALGLICESYASNDCAEGLE